MILQKYFIVFISLLGLHCGSYAQELFTKKVSISDGLIGYDNYGMLEDANGAIWISSENGIVKLQANNHKRFTSSDGLLTNDVWQMTLDPKGRIWLRSYAPGIQYIYHDTIFTVKHSKQFDEIQYSGFHRDTCFFSVRVLGEQKRYFLASDGTLKHYARFNELGYEVKGDFSKHGFFLLSKTISGSEEDYYYFLDSKRIETANGRFKNMQFKEFLDEAPVFRCYFGKAKENSDLAIFIPSKGGFKPILKNLWNEANFRNVFHFDNKHVVINIKGKAQVFNSNDAFTRNTKIEEVINRNFDFPNEIGGILHDKQGNLWLLHLRGEVHFVHNAAFWAKQLDFGNEKRNNSEVFQPVSLKKDGLFVYVNFASEICFFNAHTRERKVLYKYSGAIRELKILENELFVLQENGIAVLGFEHQLESVALKNTKFYPFKLKQGNSVLAFDILQKNKLILSSGHIIELHPNCTLTYKKIENFTPLFRTEKIIVANDIIVCCSNTKCYFFDLNTKKEIKVTIASPSCIQYIQGHIFIGTFGHGCYTFDLATRKLNHVFDSKEDVLNVVYNKSLYLCTSQGIIAGQVQNNLFRATHSYLNQEYFSLRINDLLVGTHLIALTNFGVMSIDLENKTLFEGKVKPWEGIEFNLSAKHLGNLILSDAVIPYNQNAIQFVLSDGSFFNSSSTVYRYKLKGYSKTWKYTNNGRIELSNLRTGTYSLIVQSSFSNHGIFLNQKSFNFQISKPFYSNQYFIISSILVVLILLVAINYFVRSFAFRKAKRVSKLRELEYQALQAQLNPHFVFNCLNNLQRMMILSDEREVNEYICSFAGLMRNVLDNSKKKKITLKEEIELLENYLRIEQIRLSGSLNYSIHIAPEIDQLKTEVYGMVFQPFVENAIIHGFMTNQEHKEITINFVLLESNILLGTVTDNGIGREKSQQLKKIGLYKSWASTILKEKSELLNIARKNELSFEIIDLYSNNVATGTKVEVKMRID